MEGGGRLIFFWVPALVLSTVTPRIDDDNDENHKTQANEHYHSGVAIPDCSQPICQLGPIHAAAPYTAVRQK
jgi:hypothetical protein